MMIEAADPIVAVEAIELSIPFEDGGEGIGLTPQRWRSLDQVLVRIETKSGRVGWGDAFAYACRKPVAAAVREMVAPLLIGRDPTDPAALNEELQRKLHLFGRYGITIFAISGADIALWDLKAQAAGLPLSALIGGARRDRIDSYASLVRYGEAGLVERYAREAVADGYRSVKLHEIEAGCIAAGRRGAGEGVHLTVDVNCVWSGEKAQAMLPILREQAVDWLEEPIFPPEDHGALAALRGRGVRIAAGENACTSMAFRQMLQAGAIDVAQPSVTKVGGVTEFMRVAALCASHDVPLMPHSPYFGPGYWATLHCAAVLGPEPLFEVLAVKPAAECGLDRPRPTKGWLTPPASPGLGFLPDPDTVQRYRV